MDPFWRKNLRGVENYVDTLYGANKYKSHNMQISFVHFLF